MKRGLFILCIGLGCFVNAQETIDFEFSFPEKSHFKMDYKSDNSGVMNIVGTAEEMNALKQSGYNENRNLDYKSVYVIDVKTRKNSNLIPFEFYYDKIDIDINSDGKKQNVSYSFPDVLMKGEYANSKFRIIQKAETGLSQKDDFINSSPKYFMIGFPKVENMKIGDSFSVERSFDSGNNKDFVVQGESVYTLQKIEKEFSYFSVEVRLKNNQNSSLKLNGKGSGEMVYNHVKKIIQNEKLSIDFVSELKKETFTIKVTNKLLTNYKLNFIR